MKNTQTKLQILEDKYFDALEENCVDFTEHDDAGKSLVTDEYNSKTIQEMCEYLDMPEWVIEWTVEMIEEEEKLLAELDEMAKHYQTEPKEIDTCTEYGIIKNEPMKKGSTIL